MALNAARPLGLALAMSATLACAHQELGRVRFRNEAPIWAVDDRRDVPVQPARRETGISLYAFEAFLLMPLRVARAPGRPAQGVSSLGEVPDSTWFTNRIGRRELGVDEIRRGPLRDEDGPEQHLPWTIQSTKPGGMSVGFVIRDTRGAKYLLKFDVPGAPEMETAADVIANRLLWAAGYNVPEDSLAEIRRQDLVVSPEAVVKDEFGAVRPLTGAEVDRLLNRVEAGAGGRLRVLLSRYLDGEVLGGFSSEGVRADDPNDRIPHELRRDVRGMQPIFAWLNHADVKEANTVDTWVENPARPGTHLVRHNLVDFGKALGVAAVLDRVRQTGFAHDYDVRSMALSLITLGLWRRPWDGLEPPELVGVGLLESERFDPGGWRSWLPYRPFEEMDRFDGFWGARIVSRFSREQIQAAVDAGRLSSPRARDYLVETLVARQRKVAAHWFERVTPLDGFRVEPETEGGGAHRLCLDDLLVRGGLDPAAAAATRYEALALDEDAVATGWTAQATPGSDGGVCLGGLHPSGSREGYTMVRIVTRRGERVLPAVMVHLALEPGGGRLRVIGLERG